MAIHKHRSPKNNFDRTRLIGFCFRRSFLSQAGSMVIIFGRRSKPLCRNRVRPGRITAHDGCFRAPGFPQTSEDDISLDDLHRPVNRASNRKRDCEFLGRICHVSHGIPGHGPLPGHVRTPGFCVPRPGGRHEGARGLPRRPHPDLYPGGTDHGGYRRSGRSSGRPDSGQSPGVDGRNPERPGPGRGDVHAGVRIDADRVDPGAGLDGRRHAPPVFRGHGISCAGRTRPVRNGACLPPA